MKKLLHLLLILLVLGALGAVLWRGWTHREAGHEEAEKPAAEGAEKHEESEEFTVKLSAEKLKLLAVQTAPPKAMEAAPRRRAFGRVLDPTPLLELEQEAAVAESALRVSKGEFERTQKLLAASEATSRKAAEAAEAQFRGDELKLEGVRRRISLAWGDEIAALNTAGWRELAAGLLKGTSVLVTVEVLPGDGIAGVPQKAEIVVLGHEEQAVVAASIAEANVVDTKTQGQAFLLKVERPPFPLRPGTAVTAWLELPEKARAGFLVPRAAILRHDGRTWVYVAEEDGEFARKPVKLELPLADGWFVPAEGGVEAEEKLVIAGAPALLAEELKAQGGAEPD
jgi:hypothetical protein